MIPQRRKKPRRVDPERCPAHLAWIRGFNCSAQGCKAGPIEAHHVRMGSNAGLGIKPADERAIPLCQTHHAQLDSPSWSEREFYRVHAIDTEALISHFIHHSPPLRRRRAA